MSADRDEGAVNLTSDVTAEVAEATEYLIKVVSELQKREQALAKVQGEISLINANLAALSTSRSLMQGSTLSLVAAEACKAQYRRRRKKLIVEARKLEDEVLRARERKVLVEAEIEELEGSYI